MSKAFGHFLGMHVSTDVLSKDFSKIARSLTSLLAKEISSLFTHEYHQAFEILNELISAPIIHVPDWS